MRLCRLYSNQPEKFGPIEFVAGLNVVLAEIRVPANRDRDTHNLGKTTLGRVVDFCLLKTRNQTFFLFKHAKLFGAFVFFLEIQLCDGTYVTIRRSVTEANKISFRRHGSTQEYSSLLDDRWDHREVPFEKARALLDGLLDLRALQPWNYRKIVGYLLRSQDDYREVFQLSKFAGPHSQWKPFLAHLLGFDAKLVSDHYEKEDELSQKEQQAQLLGRELGEEAFDGSKLEGILLLKQADADKKQSLLDAFDFRNADKAKTGHLVNELDVGISRLNAERYSLAQNKKKLASALEDEAILFDPNRAAELFAEAGVTFGGQIKRDFEQLIAFNRAISEERRAYLTEELADVDTELKRTNSELTTLGKRRTATLAFLTETDAFAKFKQLTNELVTLRADIESLRRQRDLLGRLQALRVTIRRLVEEKTRLHAKIEEDVSQQNRDGKSKFSSVRLHFNDIVESVIDKKAILTVETNKEGHLEFKAEILDESGTATSADLGFTYRKLLCVAFDLSLSRVHLDVSYPRFVFHDGIFESLDDRKKSKLMNVLRAYAALGIQEIITMIDSDLPTTKEEKPFLSSPEVILRLHDEDESGRLFRMGSW